VFKNRKIKIYRKIILPAALRERENGISQPKKEYETLTLYGTEIILIDFLKKKRL
jgi:hypothetical protein